MQKQALRCDHPGCDAVAGCAAGVLMPHKVVPTLLRLVDLSKLAPLLLPHYACAHSACHRGIGWLRSGGDPTKGGSGLDTGGQGRGRMHCSARGL